MSNKLIVLEALEVTGNVFFHISSDLTTEVRFHIREFALLVDVLGDSHL